MDFNPGVPPWADRRPTVIRRSTNLVVAALGVATTVIYTVPIDRRFMLLTLNLRMLFTAGVVGDTGFVDLESDPSGGGFVEILKMGANAASPTPDLFKSWGGIGMPFVAGDFLSIRVDAGGSAVVLEGRSRFHGIEYQVI